MSQTFSANRIAELLERDRATIVRALRHTPSDATEKGQPRWKMTTALAAVDRLPGSHNAKSHRRNSNTNMVSDEEFTKRMFAISESFTRGSDALVAMEKMPAKLRKAESARVFELMERLRSAFEKAEPEGLSEEPQNVLGAMFRGLLHACNVVLTEPDGKTPLKAFYGDKAPRKSV